MALQHLLPRWQSHKLVSAAKITKVRSDDTMELETKDAGGAAIAVKPADRMFARYRPVAGDYYVIYDDGYASISPAAAFEAGYHKL